MPYLIIIRYLNIVFIKFADEVIYINAGKAYIRGVAPYFINFEHPPLAKYVIGFFSMLGISTYLPMIMIISAIVLIYYIVHRYLNYKHAYLYLAIVATDTLVINASFFNLLNCVTLLLVVLYLYVALKCITLDKHGKIYVLGFLAGLALASKWSSIYIMVPVLLTLFIFNKEVIRRIHILLAMALVAYITTFIMDFVSGGPYLFVKHNIDMINYMLWRHSATLPLMVNGFLTLIGKVSFWFHKYHEYITLTIVNSSYVNYTIFLPKVCRLLVEFECWLGSFAWPLMFYYSLKLVYDSIKNKDRTWAIISSAILGSALLPILHGNMAWYYLFYAVLAPIAMIKYAPRRLLLIVIALNVTQIVLLKLRILSIMYSFSF